MPLILLLALATSDPLAALRAQDERVARIGYRLASAGAALCRGQGHPAGLVVERISQYARADRAAAVAAGLGPLPVVTVVVPDSPAAMAGLKVGDQIAAIDGVGVAPEDPARVADGYAAVADVRRRLDTALSGGLATLMVVANGAQRAATIVAPSGCAAQFEIRPTGTLGGSTDGTVIQVTSGVVDVARTDAALASVIAHELAHNILHHPQTLRAIGRPRRAVKETEIAADRLSVYLLDAAGYSFDEALAAREGIGRRTNWGILSAGTHPGWRQTVALMQAEHARIVELRARGAPVLPPPEISPP